MIKTGEICLFSLIGLAAVAVTGCSSKSAAYSSYNPNVLSSTYGAGADTAGSLFPSDQAVLSNEDIDRILSANIVFPATPRMAVMKVGARQQRYWSENSPILGRETTETFLEALRQSPRVTYAAALPSILVPEKLGVPYLREAAARFQADTLLVYRVETGSFEKYRSFREDQVKAYCTVEAALLDVRSGTVPFTTVAFEQVHGARAEGDLNFDETVDRAYHEAEARALQQVATAVRGYLESSRVAGG